MCAHSEFDESEEHDDDGGGALIKSRTNDSNLFRHDDDKVRFIFQHMRKRGADWRSHIKL